MSRTVSPRLRFAVVLVASFWTGVPASHAGAPPDRAWLGVDGTPLPFAGPDEVEAFLATAEIVEEKKIHTGRTAPTKLLLERDGIRAHAVFKDVDEIVHHGVTRIEGVTVADFRDFHLHDCAAYRLDRLLGLGRVPPSVPREVKGRQGTVTLWIEHTIMEKDRRSKQLGPPDPYFWEQQKRIMYVFDNLIGNADPNLGNILIDRSWRLWFIDHTRAFVTSPSLMNPNGARKCERELYGRLQELGADDIRRELEPYLSTAQIDALLARRGRILERLAEEIETRGERLVIFDLRPAPSRLEDW